MKNMWILLLLQRQCKKYHLYREKNQANIKKFIEEQKNQGFKQNKVQYWIHRDVLVKNMAWGKGFQEEKVTEQTEVKTRIA